MHPSERISEQGSTRRWGCGVGFVGYAHPAGTGGAPGLAARRPTCRPTGRAGTRPPRPGACNCERACSHRATLRAGPNAQMGLRYRVCRVRAPRRGRGGPRPSGAPSHSSAHRKRRHSSASVWVRACSSRAHFEDRLMRPGFVGYAHPAGAGGTSPAERRAVLARRPAGSAGARPPRSGARTRRRRAQGWPPCCTVRSACHSCLLRGQFGACTPCLLRPPVPLHASSIRRYLGCTCTRSKLPTKGAALCILRLPILC